MNKGWTSERMKRLPVFGGLVFGGLVFGMTCSSAIAQQQQVSERTVYGHGPNALVSESGGVKRLFIYDRGQIVAEVTAGGTEYILNDLLGSPRAVINGASSEVVAQYDYSPFGEMSQVAGTPRSPSHGFAGGQYDAEEQLVLFGRYHYMPAFHRYLSRSGEFSPSPYVFNGGNPLAPTAENN